MYTVVPAAEKPVTGRLTGKSTLDDDLNALIETVVSGDEPFEISIPTSETAEHVNLRDLQALAEAKNKAGSIEDLEIGYAAAFSKIFGIAGINVRIFKMPAETEKYTRPDRPVLRLEGVVHGVFYHVAALEFPNQESAIRFLDHPLYGVIDGDISGKISDKLEAWIDERTGLFSEDYMRDFIDRRKSLAEAMKTGYGIIWADVDGFKEINKRYGHPEGDRVLRDVGHAVRSVTRDQDFVIPVRRGRGADEILIYTLGCSIEDMEAIAERIRQSVQEYHVGGKPITISIGFAHSSELKIVGSKRILTKLTKMADDRMYESKDNGGNQITGTYTGDPFRVKTGSNYLGGNVVFFSNKGKGRAIHVKELVQ